MIRERCSGCGACVAICPQNAIEVKKDDLGFHCIKIIETKCVHCDLCKKVCPIQFQNGDNEILCAFGIKNNNIDLRKSSASGGVFSLLADITLHRNGVVYGAAFDEHYLVRHTRGTSENSIKAMRGSKYVESDFTSVYNMLIEDIKNQKFVLVTGTPCQIAAVKKYLEVKNVSIDNVLLVDIICHGVGSPRIWLDYITELKAKYGEITDYSFRDKEISWVGYPIKIITKDMKKVNGSKNRFFIELYNKSLIMREECYSCQFSRTERVSDITIGDLWGCENFEPSLYDRWGVSLVLANTERGLEIIHELQNCKKVEIDYKECKQTNLYMPTAKPDKKLQFDFEYKKYGYKKIEKYYTCIWKISELKTIIKNKIMHRK